MSGEGDLDYGGNSSLNATGFSSELYPGAHLVQFFTLTLPTIILCIIAVIAITRAKQIDWKFKTILINIFATEIYFSAGMTLRLLGYHIRLLIDDNPATLVNMLCKVTISSIIASGLAKVFSIALYSIATYFFIKTNIKRIKWYAIILPLVPVWLFAHVFSIAVFAVSSTFIPRLFAYRGFCSVDLEDNLNVITLPALISAWIINGSIGVFIITFVILTYCYIKTNTLGSDEVKKATAKNLLYFTGGAFFTIANSALIPTIMQLTAFEPNTSNLRAAITRFAITEFFIDILRSLSSLYIPVVTITIVKAVRMAMKQCCIPKSLAKVSPQSSIPETR